MLRPGKEGTRYIHRKWRDNRRAWGRSMVENLRGIWPMGKYKEKISKGKRKERVFGENILEAIHIIKRLFKAIKEILKERKKPVKSGTGVCKWDL